MKKLHLALACSAIIATACSNNEVADTTYTSGDTGRITKLERELEASRDALERERRARSQAESAASVAVASASQGAGAAGGGQLLPPNAKTGECYARVWVDPTYRTLSKTITVQEASESVSIVPAQYEWVEEEVLVKEASSKLVQVPAVYDTVKETILVSDRKRTWKTALRSGKTANAELLLAAQRGGINLDAATPNSCYHEHVVPAETRVVSKEVEVSPANFRIETVPAEYRWVEKSRLVKEASTKLVQRPAKYETVSEQIVDKPAHTTWKKGTGPIQKIDDATGEIMCLVEVPATYKTITRRKLVAAAYTETIEIPAEYETVKVRELVSSPSERRIDIAAKYKTVNSTEVIGEDTFVWHEVSDTTMDSESRTGNQICLLERPEKYQTVTRQVVVTPASTNTIEIPAVYETKKVRKLVSEAREERTAIPAVYDTVSYRELEREGFMDWRTILCDTNMSPSLIRRLQGTLNEKGYDVGTPDGVIGPATMRAVNAYQADNKLPQDRYLNMETVRHLNLL